MLQIEKTKWRKTLAGCSVMIHELLDGSVVIRYGPHEVARFGPDQLPAATPKPTRSARPLGLRRKAA